MAAVSLTESPTLNLLRSLTYPSFLLLLALLPFCWSGDDITAGTRIYPNGSTLVSDGGMFELGFFTLNGSSGLRSYVGIWYYRLKPRIYVWVANRNQSMGSRASLAFVGGNLEIRDDEKGGALIWSRPLDSSNSSSNLAKLMDSGNLVLSDESGKTIWQSFDEPTDTFLPGMRMKPTFKLTSWAAADDPKNGSYTFQRDEAGTNKYVIKNETHRTHWKSEVSGDFITDDAMLSVVSYFLSSFSKTQSQKLYQYLVRRNSTSLNISKFEFDYNYTRLVMRYNGTVQFLQQNKSLWLEPKDKCSLFRACGDYGICNSDDGDTEKCTCLEGFEPTDPKSWDSGVFSQGCTRKIRSKCDVNGGKDDTFSNLRVVKVEAPDSRKQTHDEEKCHNDCLSDCHCQAYSFEKAQKRSDNSTCWTWSDKTILGNIQELPELVEDSTVSRKLRVRVPFPDVPGKDGQQGGSSTQKEKTELFFLIALASAAIVVITVCSVLYALRKRGRKQGNRENVQENLEFRLYDSEKRIKQWMDSQRFEEDDKTGIDVPFFDLDIILEATNNFSEENKLGRGGFGPVYKATFPGGQEIAVKRLLSGSGQGLVEFKNEVVLIAKLQHRNLVRLVGYCMRGDEKMLLYEYMPNKSLDAFIFDRTRSLLLPWDVLFEIILGVARGMLYLHQDSRLRIIHRDIKTSNILLDEEMNPKISDFGLARIFEAKQTEASTERIMGTYGYMSPEYALDGFFSIKSDVFSFGVVVLEIISGKRNTSFYQTEGKLNLLTYAWKLWRDNSALNLLDHAVRESFNRTQVLKCINVALLCVQEDPTDRPTMSTVVFMLGSELASLPNPKQPAFAVQRSINSSASSSSRPESSLELSSTLVEGR